MERAQSSPSGGDEAERNFFRRNGGCIGPAPKGLLTSPPVRTCKGPPPRHGESPPPCIILWNGKRLLLYQFIQEDDFP